MKIRKARLNDKKELIELIQLADERTKEKASKKVEKYLNSKKGFFLLAIENKKIIGYLLFSIKEDEDKISGEIETGHSSVEWIAVHPDFRNKKIGSKLLNKTKEYIKKYKTKGLLLTCRDDALEFYKKNNFKKIKTYNKKTKSGKIKPCYIMIKKLK
jgi:ribosomal protein S18 acetylase RimI-like enzyme